MNNENQRGNNDNKGEHASSEEKKGHGASKDGEATKNKDSEESRGNTNQSSTS